jgi:acyl-CoA synthetase (AMP-forming)/AMP-acid ligase II
VPELFVQLRDVTPATPTEFVAILTKDLNDVLVSSFSRTRRPVVIKVVESMPAHATGKVQKGKLTSDQVIVLYQQLVS